MIFHCHLRLEKEGYFAIVDEYSFKSPSMETLHRPPTGSLHLASAAGRATGCATASPGAILTSRDLRIIWNHA